MTNTETPTPRTPEAQAVDAYEVTVRRNAERAPTVPVLANVAEAEPGEIADEVIEHADADGIDVDGFACPALLDAVVALQARFRSVDADPLEPEDRGAYLRPEEEVLS